MSNKIICPVCKSEDTEDASIREDNGVMGPGYASWVVQEQMLCEDCGILFKHITPTKRSVANNKNETLGQLKSFLQSRRQTASRDIDTAISGLMNAIADSNSTSDWSYLATRNKTELYFIDMLYNLFPDLKP